MERRTPFLCRLNPTVSGLKFYEPDSRRQSKVQGSRMTCETCAARRFCDESRPSEECYVSIECVIQYELPESGSPEFKRLRAIETIEELPF